MGINASRLIKAEDMGSPRPLARLSPEERRRIILSWAARSFDVNGFDATSMQKIADELGITKAAIYYYFDSKQDILFQLHDAFITDLAEQAEASLTEERSPAERLHFLVCLIIQNVADYQHYVRVFFREGHRLDPLNQQKIREKRDAYSSFVEQCIVDGMIGGTFRADISPSLATLFLFGACNWSYQWLRMTGPLTPPEIGDAFFRLIYDALKLEAATGERPSESSRLGSG